MTLRELFATVDAARVPLLIGLGAVVVLTGLLGLLHGRGNGGRAPWRHLYAFLVYAACVPGIFAAVAVIVYALLFTGENLLDLNAAAYLAPVVSMVLTLGLMRRNVSFDEVPGFRRLTGLMTMIGVIVRHSCWCCEACASGCFSAPPWGGSSCWRRQCASFSCGAAGRCSAAARVTSDDEPRICPAIRPGTSWNRRTALGYRKRLSGTSVNRVAAARRRR